MIQLVSERSNEDDSVFEEISQLPIIQKFSLNFSGMEPRFQEVYKGISKYCLKFINGLTSFSESWRNPEIRIDAGAELFAEQPEKPQSNAPSKDV